MDGAISRHSDGTVCAYSVDSDTCDHTDHRPCSVCEHEYNGHWRTFGAPFYEGCSECNDCEGYAFWED